MKRFVALVLLMLYAVSIIGILAQVHVCGGHITSLSINVENKGDKCCCDSDDSCSDESDKSDCCHSTTISTSNPDNHLVCTPAPLPDTKLTVIYSILKSIDYSLFLSNNRLTFADYSHAPPNGSSHKNPLYLRLHILLI